MELDIGYIWAASGFLVTLQLGAFTWRVNREIKMSEKGDINWLPLADILNLIALIVILGGVFILPLLGTKNMKLSQIALGVSIIFFAGYPFALAGHYELFSKGKRSMKYFPAQERIVIIITILSSILFLILALK